jgi:hypothetical protein
MRLVVDQFAGSLQTDATKPPTAAGLPLHYLTKSLAKLLETARRDCSVLLKIERLCDDQRLRQIDGRKLDRSPTKSDQPKAERGPAGSDLALALRRPRLASARCPLGGAKPTTCSTKLMTRCEQK